MARPRCLLRQTRIGPSEDPQRASRKPFYVLCARVFHQSLNGMGSPHGLGSDEIMR